MRREIFESEEEARDYHKIRLSEVWKEMCAISTAMCNKKNTGFDDCIDCNVNWDKKNNLIKQSELEKATSCYRVSMKDDSVPVHSKLCDAARLISLLEYELEKNQK